jgi:hypothetical protein
MPDRLAIRASMGHPTRHPRENLVLGPGNANDTGDSAHQRNTGRKPIIG